MSGVARALPSRNAPDQSLSHSCESAPSRGSRLIFPAQGALIRNIPLSLHCDACKAAFSLGQFAVEGSVIVATTNC